MSRLGNYSSYCQLVGHILGIESIAAWVSLDDKEVNNWHKVLALFVALVTSNSVSTSSIRSLMVRSGKPFFANNISLFRSEGFKKTIRTKEAWSAA